MGAVGYVPVLDTRGFVVEGEAAAGVPRSLRVVAGHGRGAMLAPMEIPVEPARAPIEAAPLETPVEAALGEMPDAFQVVHAIPTPVQGPGARTGDVTDGVDGYPALTHVGVAERLVQLYSHHLLYVSDEGGWRLWRNQTWVPDVQASHVQCLLTRLTTEFQDRGHEARQSGNSDNAEKLLTFARRLGSQTFLDQCLRAAERQLVFAKTVSDFDCHPDLIGLDQGRQVLSLSEGFVRPSRPRDLVTKSLAVSAYGDSAKAIRWRQFLDEVFLGDDDLIAFIHRWCGYLLSPSTGEHVFLFLYGDGRNGKSVFLNVLLALLGPAYGKSLGGSTLTKHRQESASSSELAELAGTRLAVSMETSEGVAFDEELIKTLTGGGLVRFRKLYANSIEFRTTFKLMMCGNHKPAIRGTDTGIWRRVRVVPFLRTFTDADVDLQLESKLLAERPHILAWMVEGYQSWARMGLGRPALVEDATKMYRSEEDILGAFLDETCELGASYQQATNPLHDAYRVWAAQNLDGRGAMIGKIALMKKLYHRPGLSRGFTHGGVALLKGLRLKPLGPEVAS